MAARLMALPADRTAAAMALAAATTGGNLQSFADGTAEWRYQVGMVAHPGLVAARLAAAGALTAPPAVAGTAGLIPPPARHAPGAAPPARPTTTRTGTRCCPPC